MIPLPIGSWLGASSDSSLHWLVFKLPTSPVSYSHWLLVDNHKKYTRSSNTAGEKCPNVAKTIISHPPIITIFMGGMITIPNHIFVVKNGIVLPTSIHGGCWEAMETHRSMLGRPPTQAARVEAARPPRSPESPEPSRRGPGSVEPWSPPDKNALELLTKSGWWFQTIGKLWFMGGLSWFIFVAYWGLSNQRNQSGDNIAYGSCKRSQKHEIHAGRKSFNLTWERTSRNIKNMNKSTNRSWNVNPVIRLF